MKENPILLIDYKCAICSKAMHFIIKKGGEDKFDFLSLYSDKAKVLLVKYGLSPDYNKSLVLIENNQVFIKSNAVIRIASKLNGIYPMLRYLKIIPQKIRDSLYDFVSKHRHYFTINT